VRGNARLFIDGMFTTRSLSCLHSPNPAATLIGQGGDFLFPVEGAKMKSQTVDDFCTAHGISRGLFYQLVKRGEAPKTFKIGRCTRISETAALDWVASREAIAA
jgi:predicted DNA-binding transcriptional regulator AlpA